MNGVQLLKPGSFYQPNIFITRSGTLVKVTVTKIFRINEAGQGQIYFFR